MHLKVPFSAPAQPPHNFTAGSALAFAAEDCADLAPLTEASATTLPPVPAAICLAVPDDFAPAPLR